MIYDMAAKTKTQRPGRSGPKAEWKHIGADIPPTLYERFTAEAKRQGVPQAVILRWAVADYLGPDAEGGGE